MKLTATREDLLAPLQSVIGVVERRQTMPVLANVLLSARDNRLAITGTDLEVELVAATKVGLEQPGDITVPGRKLVDIFRALPDGVNVTLSTEGERAMVRAGRSRFTLSTLPAAEFPVIEEINAAQTLSLPQGEFRRLIDKTHFSMAQQDVRYYLNGLLLETQEGVLRAVATDGHRLALCEMALPSAGRTGQVIVPRKGVLELQRILGTEGTVELAIGYKSRSRPDRRHSVHFEADRWQIPGVWAGHSQCAGKTGAGRSGAFAAGAAADGHPFE